MSKILAVRMARVKTQLAIFGGLLVSIGLALASVPSAIAAPSTHAEIINLATMLAAPVSEEAVSQTSALVIMVGALITMIVVAWTLGRSLGNNITEAGRGRM